MPDNKKKTEPEGNDPKKPDAGKETQFDPSKLSDEDLGKVFEDPRLWEHKRFKELNENAKAGKDALAKLEKLEEDRLKEEGKFKELAEKAQAKADEANKALVEERKNNALIAEATKQGVVDLEAVLKLVDRSGITVNKDGNIEGHADAVKTLLEAKTYLKGGNTPTPIGSGTQPGSGTNDAKKFTLSQISDAAFYQENKEDIMQAYKTGNIIDDSSQGSMGSNQGTPPPQS